MVSLYPSHDQPYIVSSSQSPYLRPSKLSMQPPPPSPPPQNTILSCPYLPKSSLDRSITYLGTYPHISLTLSYLTSTFPHKDTPTLSHPSTYPSIYLTLPTHPRYLDYPYINTHVHTMVNTYSHPIISYIQAQPKSRYIVSKSKATYPNNR